MLNRMPILLVEDDKADAVIIRRAFNDLNVQNELVNKVDGEDALEYLRRPTNKKPCVILLDLNMPRMNGFEFLKIIKADEALKQIPVVVLTTSTEERDVARGFELGVAGYIVKPVTYAQSVEAMKTLDTYWTLSKLPSENIGIPAGQAFTGLPAS